jgi:hypothetical protein
MRNILLAVPAVLVGCLSVSAGTITVLNPSFEAPVQGAGGFTVGTVTSWTSAGTSGVFRPTASELNSVPDGFQVGYSNLGALSQILSAVLANNTVYTLQVDVGKRLDCCTSFGPIVQLWAGSTLLATAAIVSPTPGNFLTETLIFTSLASDPNVGQTLKIVLDSTGNQTDFDNVRLDGTAVSAGPVPEPRPIALLGAGLLALVIRKRIMAK